MKLASANSPGSATVRYRPALILGLIAALLVTLAFGAFGASAAKAEEVNFELDRGIINLGGEDGLWPPVIDPEVDPPATIATEVDGEGNLTAAQSDFFFPAKRIEELHTGNSLLPVVDAEIAIAADADLSGNFDTGTGAGTVVLPADVLITVYSAGSPASVARCRIDGFNLNLATEGVLSDPGAPEDPGPPPMPARPAQDYEGVPFAGPDGEGSFLATWSGLPSAQEVSGSLAWVVCPALDDMLGGPGAVWLAGQTVDDITVPLPTKAPKLTATPSASTEQTTAEFKYEAGDGEPSPVAGFQCRLDSGSFTDCSSGTQTYSGLAEGSHTFTVRAFNATGAGPEATFSWQVTKASQDCPSGFTGTPPNCERVRPEPPRRARLGAMKVAPRATVIRRGRAAIFRVAVRNAGNAAARGVRICVTAPRKVRVKRCVRVGVIRPRTAKVARFRVIVPRRARGRAALTFRANSANAGKRAARAIVRIR